MANATYRVILQPLAEGGYMASVPAMPEIQGFGDTLEQAKAACQLALQGALAGYGDMIPPDFPGEPVVDVIRVPLRN